MVSQIIEHLETFFKVVSVTFVCSIANVLNAIKTVIADEDGVTVFITDPTDLDLVSKALPEHGFTVLSNKLGYKPKNPVDPANLSAEQLEEVENFLAMYANPVTNHHRTN